MQGIVITPVIAPLPMSLNSFTLPMAQDKPFTGLESGVEMARRRRRRRR